MAKNSKKSKDKSSKATKKSKDNNKADKAVDVSSVANADWDQLFPADSGQQLDALRALIKRAQTRELDSFKSIEATAIEAGRFAFASAGAKRLGVDEDRGLTDKQVSGL